MTDHLEMLKLISDLHKDARGFRPSNDLRCAYGRMTTEELTSAWDGLCAELSDTMAREEADHAIAAATFEARVSSLLACGAGDRATAIRWIVDAEDLAEDVSVYGLGALCYRLNLSMSYFTQKEAA